MRQRAERLGGLTEVLAPLLLKLFAVLAVGALLRTRLPARTPHVVNRVVIDALMPVLLLIVLLRARVDFSAAEVLVPTAIAQVVTCALALALARAFALSRAGQGSAAMTTTFSNTGFLGFPVVIALYGAQGAASSTAILVDTVSTTVWLWTFGVVIAARFGSGRAFSARGLLRALLRPLTICVVLGVPLSFALSDRGVSLPSAADLVVTGLGGVVSVLVFFSLGLSLDLGALKGRLAPLSAMTALKLLVMPVVVLVVARALAIPEPSLSVAVLQCAMPSAMVSVIISREEGCDAPFATGVAALSTLACVVTLPLIGWVIGR